MRAIVLLSGGVDSAVALYWARSQNWDIFALEFEYYERPERERRSCRDLCTHAGISNRIVAPIQFIREISDIPAPELANPALARAPQGYIPLRNLIFYSLSGYHAEILGARHIVGGHNRTDCESFPDAGKPFWEQLNQIFKIAIWSHSEVQTEIILPLIDMGKAEVVRLGSELRVPFELTWSCYFNADCPCGACASCLERAEAFAAAGLD
ncbi:MAG: 7-cyano-7-deazaguanine synthase [Acidobacteriia bacterium]|nr:7-cyano-7-deazaguanine synthase [Terriglobia bacterium]